MNINKECHSIIAIEKICRDNYNECYEIQIDDKICTNEVGQSTFFCKNFILVEKLCKYPSNYFCRAVNDVGTDCIDQIESTCRAYLVDECLKPLTNECIKILNGDSQCRNMNQN